MYMNKTFVSEQGIIVAVCNYNTCCFLIKFNMVIMLKFLYLFASKAQTLWISSTLDLRFQSVRFAEVNRADEARLRKHSLDFLLDFVLGLI